MCRKTVSIIIQADYISTPIGEKITITFSKIDPGFYSGISNYFDKIRFQSKLSIKKMAEQCGITEANLSKVYSYQTGLDSLRTLSRLCHGHKSDIEIVIGPETCTHKTQITYKWVGKEANVAFQKELGKALMTARQAQGISQRTLGELTGDRSRERNVGEIERGIVLAEISNLEKYCNVLKLRLTIVVRAE